MRQGWSVSLVQAAQPWSRISPYEAKTRFEIQFSRRNGQTVSTGWSSGDRDGRGTSVMLAGPLSLFDWCQPAWSRRMTACAPGATALEISASSSAIASVVQRGRTRPAPLPSAGQMAPKMEADAVLWSLGAEGRVPRLAQRRVIVFFCPTLASSANQISTGLPPAWSAAIASRSVGNSFEKRPPPPRSSDDGGGGPRACDSPWPAVRGSRSAGRS